MDSRDNEIELLDRWLDGALRQYSNAAPRPGLETRILANLALAEKKRLSRVGWVWIVAGSVGFVAIAIAIASLSFNGAIHKSPLISTRNNALHPPQLAKTNDAATPRFPLHAPATVHSAAYLRAKIRTNRAHDKGAELAAAPRLAQFPSPRQLSEQERLLKDFVRNSPEEAVQVAQEQEERQHELQTLMAASDSESAQQER